MEEVYVKIIVIYLPLQNVSYDITLIGLWRHIAIAAETSGISQHSLTEHKGDNNLERNNCINSVIHVIISKNDEELLDRRKYKR